MVANLAWFKSKAAQNAIEDIARVAAELLSFAAPGATFCVRVVALSGRERTVVSLLHEVWLNRPEGFSQRNTDTLQDRIHKTLRKFLVNKLSPSDTSVAFYQVAIHNSLHVVVAVAGGMRLDIRTRAAIATLFGESVKSVARNV